MKPRKGILVRHFSGFRMKILACFLLLTMVFQVIQPTVALALTSGPAQPEFSSFEPVNTTQLVDNFTGDFNYNIPLLTVPGPNGGYPINLAYHAGVGMEDEASWVGLGWNLNVGEISRQVRGVPDDFNGEAITKTTNLKTNWTLGVEAGVSAGQTEIFGTNLEVSLGLSAKIFYNSYRGMGFSVSADDFGIGDMRGKDLKAPWQCSVDFTLDSQSGAALTANIGMGGEMFKQNSCSFWSLEASYNSRSGLYNLGLGYDKLARAPYYNSKRDQAVTAYKRTGGSSLGYVANNNVPTTTPGFGGFTLSFIYKQGLPFTGFFPNAYARGYLNTQFIADPTRDYSSFGYLYLQNASDRDMMDYNREKQFPISPGVPSLPVPVMTHDIYSIKGQGTAGMFRAHRNDFGFLHEPATNNIFGDANAGIDNGESSIILAAMNIYSLKDGENGGITFASNYSGIWQDGYPDVNNYRYTGRNSTDNANNYRDFYFKNYGEMTMEGSESNRFNGYALADLDISLGFDLPGLIEPKLKNRRINTVTASTLTGWKKTEREFVDSNIEYFKIKEMREYTGGFLVGTAGVYSSTLIYSTESAMETTSQSVIEGSTYSEYDWNNAGTTTQIGAMRVRENNGMIYEYALPAYNKKQKDVVFAKSHSTGASVSTQLNCSYDNNHEANKSNDTDSRDQYYSSTETPAYAHSYLLTAVYSPDYVDITGDGPTKDDMGYYTKFNYVRKTDAFHWRAPFTGARFEPGYVSDDRDDKATYTYGEKEIYYLQSVETKTHIALFFLQDREDGYGPAQEDMHDNVSTVDGSKTLQCLRQIRLYKKGDGSNTAFLLKTVNFEYDYSLCPGVYNNPTSSGTGGSGKLTLKKIYFTSLQNNKGSFSPYQFVYGDSDHDGTPNINPPYNPSKMDRWGNFKSTSYNSFSTSGLDSLNFSNEPEPYVKQSGNTVQNNIKAWNLTDILLPSGGKISVDYESDDYAYVQDKKAMQMFKIIGALKDYIYGNDIGLNTPQKTLYDGNDIFQYLVVQLDRPTSSSTDITKYLENIDDTHPMYFKANMRLKRAYNGKDEADFAYDYVEGYCTVDKSGSKLLTNGGSDYVFALIKVNQVEVFQNSSGAGHTHPFSKASWEYMKVSRPDLLFPEPAGAGTLQGAANIFVSMWNDLGTLLRGYYKRCKHKDYGNEINLNTDVSFRPSYIRLNVPDGIKYGGGHRVRAIKTTDNWNTIASEGNSSVDGQYGMEFSYRMKDGTSSGVAAYEPLIGGEEIPLHLPSDRYSATRTYIHKSNELYITEPQGESFYPAPLVGYRRVVVRNSKNLDGEGTEVNKKTQGGIVEYEYYTAKDFPVIVTKSAEIDQVNPPTISVPVPGVFHYSTKTAGYSMGFQIELNNMHGQMRRVTTYPYGTDVDGGAPAYTARTEYIYNTIAPFTDAGTNQLKSSVQMLKGDGLVLNKEMGASTEFYMDMQQHSSFDFSASIRADHDWTFFITSSPPLLIFVPVNSHHFSGSMSKTDIRYAVTNKVIDRHGILTEVRTTKDGNTVKEKNLLFDYYTGQPILTTTTNEFDNPVYNYTYKGHWYYDNMGPSYNNYDYSYASSGMSFSSGSITLLAGALSYLHPGDKILLTKSSGGYQLAWISNVNTGTNTITCIDKNGTAIPSGPYDEFRVVETIHRNQQSVPVGKIVSLDNPLFGTDNSPLFTAYNNWIYTYGDGPNNNPNIDNNQLISDCEGNAASYKYGITLGDFAGFGEPNYNHIFFKANNCNIYIDLTNLGDALNETTLSDVMVYYISNTSAEIHFLGNVYTCDVSQPLGNCLPPPCNPSVLHAEASTMNDSWTYNFEDVGDPYASSGFTPANNLWRSGQKGTWRTEKQFLFQVPRKQRTPTNTAYDGTYESFTHFNWLSPGSNPLWTNVNTVTRYSPYGYELENQDVLGIYSSAIYGYSNSLMTSMSANSSYFEAGFDGFEDYVNAANNYDNGHGHIYFNSFSNDLPLVTDPHTGKMSVDLSGSHKHASGGFTPVHSVGSISGTNRYFVPVSDATNHKQYVLTYWAKPTTANAVPTTTITGATVVSSTVSKQPIEGWYRVEVVFETTNAAVTYDCCFKVSGVDQTGHIDDFRIQPFNSAMKGYVYDPNTLWLMAELDDRNFATFYNYDEEGNLVQVKKETERGVKTIQTGRKNIRRDL